MHIATYNDEFPRILVSEHHTSSHVGNTANREEDFHNEESNRLYQDRVAKIHPDGRANDGEESIERWN